MPSRFNSSLHGRPMQGPTRGRPTNAYAGEVYFDDELGCLLYFDGLKDEWRPMGVAGGDGPLPQALVEDMPGLESFDGTRATMSDGANEWNFAEEPESSSTSSSESSSASQA